MNEPTDYETRDQVLDFAEAAGFGRSATRLARFHRHGLVQRPWTAHRSGERGTETRYPVGTATQYVAALQIHEDCKLLDRIAWRLWCDSWPIDPDVIRSVMGEWTVRFDRTLSSAVTPEGELTEDADDQIDTAAMSGHLPRVLGGIRRRVGGDEFDFFLADLLAAFTQGVDALPDGGAAQIEHAIGWDRARTDTFIDKGP